MHDIANLLKIFPGKRSKDLAPYIALFDYVCLETILSDYSPTSFKVFSSSNSFQIFYRPSALPESFPDDVSAFKLIVPQRDPSSLTFKFNVLDGNCSSDYLLGSNVKFIDEMLSVKPCSMDIIYESTTKKSSRQFNAVKFRVLYDYDSLQDLTYNRTVEKSLYDHTNMYSFIEDDSSLIYPTFPLTSLHKVLSELLSVYLLFNFDSSRSDNISYEEIRFQTPFSILEGYILNNTEQIFPIPEGFGSICPTLYINDSYNHESNLILHSVASADSKTYKVKIYRSRQNYVTFKNGCDNYFSCGLQSTTSYYLYPSNDVILPSPINCESKSPGWYANFTLSFFDNSFAEFSVKIADTTLTDTSLTNLLNIFLSYIELEYGISPELIFELIPGEIDDAIISLILDLLDVFGIESDILQISVKFHLCPSTVICPSGTINVNGVCVTIPDSNHYLVNDVPYPIPSSIPKNYPCGVTVLAFKPSLISIPEALIYDWINEIYPNSYVRVPPTSRDYSDIQDKIYNNDQAIYDLVESWINQNKITPTPEYIPPLSCSNIISEQFYFRVLSENDEFLINLNFGVGTGVFPYHTIASHKGFQYTDPEYLEFSFDPYGGNSELILLTTSPLNSTESNSENTRTLRDTVEYNNNIFSPSILVAPSNRLQKIFLVKRRLYFGMAIALPKYSSDILKVSFYETNNKRYPRKGYPVADGDDWMNNGRDAAGYAIGRPRKGSSSSWSITYDISTIWGRDDANQEQYGFYLGIDKDYRPPTRYHPLVNIRKFHARLNLCWDDGVLISYSYVTNKSFNFSITGTSYLTGTSKTENYTYTPGPIGGGSTLVQTQTSVRKSGKTYYKYAISVGGESIYTTIDYFLPTPSLSCVGTAGSTVTGLHGSWKPSNLSVTDATNQYFQKILYTTAPDGSNVFKLQFYKFIPSWALIPGYPSTSLVSEIAIAYSASSSGTFVPSGCRSIPIGGSYVNNFVDGSNGTGNLSKTIFFFFDYKHFSPFMFLYSTDRRIELGSKVIFYNSSDVNYGLTSTWKLKNVIPTSVSDLFEFKIEVSIKQYNETISTYEIGVSSILNLYTQVVTNIIVTPKIALISDTDVLSIDSHFSSI